MHGCKNIGASEYKHLVWFNLASFLHQVISTVCFREGFKRHCRLSIGTHSERIMWNIPALNKRSYVSIFTRIFSAILSICILHCGHHRLSVHFLLAHEHNSRGRHTILPCITHQRGIVVHTSVFPTGRSQNAKNGSQGD